jgi:hypothetical protein
MAAEWFYTKDGKNKSGPLTDAQIQALAKSGQIRPTDMLWKEGMAKWAPASTITGMFPSSSSENEVPWVEILAEPPPLPNVTPPVTTTKTNPVEAIFSNLQSLFGKSGKNTRTLIVAGVGFFAFCGLCCCCGVVGMVSKENEKQEFAEANRLWVRGDKAGAVAKYHVVLDGSNLKEEWPSAYQRVIDFEATQGNTSSARAYGPSQKFCNMVLTQLA